MSSDLTSDIGTAGGFVCLVDGDGNYNLSEEKMTDLIKHVDPHSTQDYSIVGIMGCQSTGKSTLLNRLFKTQFQMMNADTGRSQTTKGIWLDAARNTNNLVIMDLEGTDSGERGEDRTTFERQTILYALALCEILIVNMWETDIGRYTASNYGIMKTVFEVNMQLFKSKGKTQLLFIIRDYNEKGTPFHTLRERLLREIQLIWDELVKPEEFKNATMMDFFDFRFTYLPHFVYCRDRFEELALNLQKRFTEPNNPDSLLCTEYHGSKSVPAESFAMYAHNIWNTIKDNQDLNLPTQREMLATYRCDELVSSLTTQYSAELSSFSLKTASEFNPNMGQEINEYVTKYLGEYDSACEKYLQDVVQRKRRELLHHLIAPVQEMIASSIKGFLYTKYVKEFETAINAPVVTPDEVVFGIMDVCQNEKEKYLDLFGKQSRELITGLPDEYCEELHHLIDQFEHDFEEKLQSCINVLRKQQLHALHQTAVAEFVENMTGLHALLTSAPADMWERIGFAFNTSWKHALNTLNKEVASLAQTPEEAAVVKKRVLENCEFFIFDQVSQLLPQVPTKMRDRFEERFLYDNGSLRQWKASDAPQQLFDKARQSAIVLLQTFSKFALRQYWLPVCNDIMHQQETTSVVATEGEGGDDAASDDETTLVRSPSAALLPAINIVLITKDQAYDFEKEFDRKVQGHLASAVAEVERAKANTGLPPWVIGLILILGYDEFMYILTNPLALFFIIMCGTGVFVLYKLNMLDPAITIAKAVGERLLTELTAAINPPNQQQSQSQQQQRPQQQQQQRPQHNTTASTVNTAVNTPATNYTSIASQPDLDDNLSVKSTLSAPAPLDVDVTHAAPQVSSAAPTPKAAAAPAAGSLGVNVNAAQLPDASLRNAISPSNLASNTVSRRRAPAYSTMTMSRKAFEQAMRQGQPQ